MQSSYVTNHRWCGGQMSPCHLYMWILNGSCTHESFDCENEHIIKWVFVYDSRWIIKWQGLDKPIKYGKKKKKKKIFLCFLMHTMFY